ncbi:LacI family DNA-binding transcriptional regulator [Thermodesulfobacteriota bacterium]
MEKTTMKHIAEMVGVSVTTVSRAFHSPHMVRKETYDRVMRICKKNRYVYNATAGDLSSKKSTVIGLIIPTAKDSIFGRTIMEIQERAQEVGYSIMLGITNYNKMIEQRLLQQFLERQIAGLILTGFCIGQEDYIKELVETGVPCVVRSERLDDNIISYVGFDNFKAAYSMTEYLISLNHRRIGLIIGPFSKVGRVKKRLEGYGAALEKYGIPYDPSLVIEREPTLIEGKDAMQVLMSLQEPPTAVFAASDWLAIGAMHAIKERGLHVPEDVSVAGFDNIDVAPYIDPPLTTLRTPAYEMAEKAIEVLLEMILNVANGVRQYCLDTDIIIRESCAFYKDDTQ